MPRKIIATIVLAAALSLAVVGCSSAQPSKPASSEPEAAIAASAASDEIGTPGFGNVPEFDAQCLSCHGSYEEVAEKTAHYGDSNPHDSVHGGYNSCQNCHEADKVINEDHMCVTCHKWPRDEQSSLGK